MRPKMDHPYIQIDDEIDFIQYQNEQNDEPSIDSHDLLPPLKGSRMKRRHSTLRVLASILSLLLGLTFIAIASFIYNKYTFALNAKHSNGDKFAFNDDNKEILLSPFEKAVTIETQCGRLIGVVEEDAFAFKGIPYALPPIGSLRWMRPIPINSNINQCHRDRYHHCNHYAPNCFQFNSTSNQFTGDEDCLYLNIWTPRIDDSADLNVMVYIHGNTTEGTAFKSFIGFLAKNLNVILVSINYRLDALGFLELDLISNSGPNSSFGNYGVWDVIMALTWIRENIESFGGNPDKITLFGPDGDLILALVRNKEYSQLFNSVWFIEPQIYKTRKTFIKASKENRNNFLVDTNCANIRCLQQLNAEQVIQIKHKFDKQQNGTQSKIIIDDEIIFENSDDDTINVPLLIELKDRFDPFVAVKRNSSNSIFYYILENDMKHNDSVSQNMNHFFKASELSFCPNEDHIKNIVLNFIQGNFNHLWPKDEIAIININGTFNYVQV